MENETPQLPMEDTPPTETPNSALPPTTSPTQKPANRRNAIIGGGIGVVAVGALLIALLPGVLGGGQKGSATATNDPTKTGCPGTASNVSWPKSAQETITQDNANASTTAKVGDTIEFDLPAGFRWSLSASDSAVNVLDPSGSYRSNGNVCVWRVTVQTAGATTVGFTRQPLCKQGEICSPIIINYQFAIQAN